MAIDKMPGEDAPESGQRTYVSAKRDAAAAAKRQMVLDAAGRLLDDGPAMISMEAVAKAAGVTRLTVYKQFGSRRGLLEAVFDDNAKKGGVVRMGEAIHHPDARAGIDQAIDVLCDFWGRRPAFARLHDAAAVDPEFAEAIAARNERRRLVFNRLLDRLNGDTAAKLEASDLIFGLTSMAMFRSLSATRTPEELAGTLKMAVGAILDAQGLR